MKLFSELLSLTKRQMINVKTEFSFLVLNSSQNICQATGTGNGNGIGDWDWGLGLGTGMGMGMTHPQLLTMKECSDRKVPLVKMS